MVEKKKNTVSIKTQLYVVSGAVMLLVLFGLFVAWLDTSMPIRQDVSVKKQSFRGVTLKGESVCLSHKGDGPHTMECALGVKTVSGDVYAIQGAATPTTGTVVEVTGKLMSASGDEKYDIAGTLTVE